MKRAACLLLLLVLFGCAEQQQSQSVTLHPGRSSYTKSEYLAALDLLAAHPYRRANWKSGVVLAEVKDSGNTECYCDWEVAVVRPSGAIEFVKSGPLASAPELRILVGTGDLIAWDDSDTDDTVSVKEIHTLVKAG